MRTISVITLGVEDLDRSSKFYTDLGFEISSHSDEKIVWFRTGGTLLALYPWDLLAEDANLSPGSHGFRGVSMALNMGSKADVDHMVGVARNAGARVVKEPQEVFWGGYSSYIEDLDDHLWEIVYNPYTPVDGVGRLEMRD
jgi:hypothetical protein